MKVRQLIAQLKKMPQNLEVYTNAHDNSPWEMAGETSRVDFYIKEELREDFNLDSALSDEDAHCFKSAPKQWVTICG